MLSNVCRGKKTDITMHKLDNMSLSSEVLTCLPSATSFELLNSKVREQFSFVFTDEIQKLLSIWNRGVLLPYLHHDIFFGVYSFRNASLPDYTSPSTALMLSPEV